MRFFAIACVTVVFCMIVGCQSQSTQFTAEDEATLRSIVEATARHFSAGDMETWAQLYANDAVFQPPNAPMVVGQANILEWGQSFPPLKDLTFTNVMVSGEGNVGYGTSSYDMTFSDMAADQGKQLVVFRRSSGGAWAIVGVSFNSDRPVQ